MTPEEATIETLKRWSHILLLASVILPVLGAVAAGVRFYVDRQEKQFSAQITTAAINRTKQEAASARNDVANLEKKTAPRSLSSEQQQSLLDNLKTSMDVAETPIRILIKKIPVTAAIGNQEAQTYAMQFVQVFKSSGFESELILPLFPGLRPDIIDIKIGIKDSQDIPKDALALVNILSNAGIKSNIIRLEQEFSSAFPEASFVLVVGAKPY